LPRQDSETSARLYRSRAGWPEERTEQSMEEIGSGPLAKMVRLALSDPDGDIWPYRIVAGQRVFDSEEIVALGRRL
jgi:hypothetical protein